MGGQPLHAASCGRPTASAAIGSGALQPNVSAHFENLLFDIAQSLSNLRWLLSFSCFLMSFVDVICRLWNLSIVESYYLMSFVVQTVPATQPGLLRRCASMVKKC